jgi:threonine/homoserine/homoserine lactone efflux protein
VKWRFIANNFGKAYSAVSMKFHPAIFGAMFCLFGIGALLTALFKNQPWYVRYVQVALGLTFIVLGILIPLSLRRLGYGW